MISGKNIIAIASNWHFDPTSKHHVMKILSEQNHVLWVNYHGSRCPRASVADAGAIVGKLKQIARGPERISETMMVMTPLLLPFPASPLARRCNQKWVTRQIRRVLSTFPRQPVQLWSFAPDVDYLVGQFSEELVLYYCVDEFSEFSTYDAQVIRDREQRLISKSDLVVTTARHLYESKSPLNPQTHLVTHGVSYDHFARAMDDELDTPEALRSVGRPIFGFFGMIQDWVDLELITEMARRHRDWTFVFVGRQEVSIDICRSHPNILFTGQVPFETLPAYCKSFDVGLIPFKINRLTVHVNPIKLREYLAAGLPVVSTDLPEVRQYRPHVLIGQTPDEFEQACIQALQERSMHHRLLRQQSVQSETWRDKVEQLSALVTQIQADGARRSNPPSALTPSS